MNSSLNRLWFDKKVLVLFLVIYIQSVTSFWEYSVCTRERVLFYDSDWSEVRPVIQNETFNNLKTITFDNKRDEFYLANDDGNETSIFRLKINNRDNYSLSSPLFTTRDDIKDLVYDFHDDVMFYSSEKNNRISKIIFDRRSNRVRQETFITAKGPVVGLEIDTCKRNLYFSIVLDGDSSINVIALNATSGMEPKHFGTENHYHPEALAIDHQNRRIYIADRRKYNSYSIDSISPNGTGFKREMEYSEKTPVSLAVDSQYVYYVDQRDKEIRRFVKGEDKSRKFMETSSEPMDIIVKSNFEIDLKSEVCEMSEEKREQIRKEAEKLLKKEFSSTTPPAIFPSVVCHNGGNPIESSSKCSCGDEYDGDFCEIPLCRNYCLNGGQCWVDHKRQPQCTCTAEFDGDRCQESPCHNFCLNNGVCAFDRYEKRAKCSCKDKYSGGRCEVKMSDIAGVLTTLKTAEEVSSSTTTIKSQSSEDSASKSSKENVLKHEVPESLTNGDHETLYEKSIQMECTPESINITTIILSVCGTVSLLTILVILIFIKKMNKPMRPKIRKKYVLHKNIEPLTQRPTTGQCEVIIEDCCNMNLCETPCFDPKIIQQELTEGNISVKLTSSKKCNSRSSTKEDKQDLLKNMEDSP